jgi:tetratricopeptide (TPR) repeat protein
MVITFQSFIDAHEPQPRGFGEDFLAAAGFDAIHVSSHGNAWYQYADMPAALAAIDAAAGGAMRVTYGLSMGAYAAIRFAPALRAERVVAISPQFSIDRRLAPFETRWAEFSDSIAFVCDWPSQNAIDTQANGIEVAAVYDPHDLDRRHVALIERRLPVRHVLVPYGGHPVTALLQEAGMLSGLVLDLLHDRFDSAAFAAALAGHAPRSAVYHVNQANTLPWYKPARRIALHRRAAELAPENRHIQRDLGFALIAARRYDEAVQRLQSCFDGYPTDPLTAFAFSRALSFSGRHAEAIATAEAAVRHGGDRVFFQRNLAMVRRRQRRAGWYAVLGLRRPSGLRAP